MNAPKFILVHNHPSGECTPSFKDKELANKDVLFKVTVKELVITSIEVYKTPTKTNYYTLNLSIIICFVPLFYYLVII